ncbi:MAG: hypothetical protein GX829_02225 [Clostridium sp.]|nr:hypothetical protein [Clostridium sp.]
MKYKKVICKIAGHKKGFLHKYDNYYEYVCLRCGEVVTEEIKGKIQLAK